MKNTEKAKISTKLMGNYCYKSSKGWPETATDGEGAYFNSYKYSAVCPLYSATLRS